MSATLRSVPSLPVLPGKHTNPRSVKHPKHIDPKNNVQKTAMKMLKREELNAKRSRLEALLSQQFIAKYGGKRGGGARVNSFIKSTISDFLHHFTDMDVAEGMIDNLEAKIREVTQKMREDIAVEKQTAAREQKMRRDQHQLDLQRQGSGGNQDLGGAFSAMNVEPSWAVLNALKVAEADEKEKKKVQDAANKRAEYKVQLDAQRDFLRSTRHDHGAEKRKELEHNQRVAAEHATEEQNKAVARAEKGRRERELRMLQIEANNDKKEQERQMKIMAEKADMARSKRLAEQEAAAVQHKKDMDALRVEQVKLENEKNKAMKAEAQRKQWEYEAKLNRDYEAKLAKEEKARNEAFQARLDALKKFEKGFEGVAAAAAAANTAEHEKTMAEIERKYENDARKLKEKERSRKEELVKSRAFNMTLIERKEKAKRDEKDADVARRREQQRALDEENQRESSKKAQKKMQMAQLKAELDQQVAHREKANKFTKTAGLSDQEVSLNKHLIKRIEANPELYQRVMSKVNPTPRGGMGDFKYG